MNLEGILLSEISQIEKGKYCMVSLICGIFKKMSNSETVEWWLPGAGRWGK